MTTLKVLQEDITKLTVDAIVNAANTSLLGGGGVDGAIHRAAGPQLLAKCATLHGCKTGDAKITPGYHLPAKYVIHAVGPVWHGGEKGEEQLLASCYRRALELAQENHVKSMAFPCISTGVYRFPKDRAAQIAIKTVRDFSKDFQKIEEIVFVCFSRQDFELYEQFLANVSDL